MRIGAHRRLNHAAIGGIISSMLMIAVACGDHISTGSHGSVQPAETSTSVPPADGSQVASPDASPDSSDLNTYAAGNTPAQGYPAVMPSLPVKPGQPAFTEADVRAYVLAHLPARPDPDGEPIAVKRVEFLKVEEVEVKIDHRVGVPRDTLLCLVTLSGDWLPPPNIEVTGPALPGHVMYLIFDATTGNHIASTGGVEPE